MENTNKELKFLIFLCVIFSIFCGTASAVYAKEEKKIRVGFPIQRGLTEKTEDGTYTGYTVDYLNEISKYTNWEYEYVEVEGDINTQILTLLDMLQKGEIDLLGAMNYSETLAEMFYYPPYNCGTSYTSLTVLESDPKWTEEDYASWDGLRVAVYPGIESRLELLKEFAKVNGFTFEEVSCETMEDMVKAVEEGKADAILQVDISMLPGFRSIARFYPKPYYFAVTKEKPQIYKELNQAMNSILQTYPYFQTELYNKYFSYKGQFVLSENGKRYIEELGTVKVLFFQGNKPIQDKGSQGAEGVAESFFEKLSQDTGLKYEAVFAKNYAEGLEMIKNGEADLAAAVPTDGRLQVEGSLRLSRVYFESYGLIVTEGKAQTEDEGGNLLSVNVEQALKNMEAGRISKALLDANCVSFYTRKKGLFDSLQYDWGTTTRIRYCVGVGNEKFDDLLRIINGYANSMTEDERQEMLYENSHKPISYTFLELFAVYREIWMLILAGVLFAYLLLRMHLRSKEIKKDALTNERISQFSKMTNEILFEYDYREDNLVVLDSHDLFFQDSVIDGLAKKYKKAERQEAQEEEGQDIQCVLGKMLFQKEEQRDLQFYRDEKACWYRVQIKYGGDKGEYAVGRISDVNKEIQIKKRLEQQASMDSLTRLYNRAALERFVTNYLEEAREGVFVLLDIDNFKNINDTMGHIEGDCLLQKFAAKLRKCFRQSDVCARLGGDEFCVFMLGSIGEKQLSQKLKTVLEEMNREVFLPYVQEHISVSIGAVYLNENIQDYKSLYMRADNAMYAAKFGGKNDFFIADEDVCMRKGCIGCRPTCRRKEYLLAKGALRYSSETPGKIEFAVPEYNKVRKICEEEAQKSPDADAQQGTSSM